MVGSAVEHAAKCHGETVAGFGEIDLDANPACPVTSIDFQEMMLAGEADDQQESSLAYVLHHFRVLWPNGTQARNVANHAGRPGEQEQEFLTALVAATGDRPLPTITAKTVTWRLKAIKDAPAMVGDAILVLRHTHDHYSGDRFTVVELRDRRDVKP
jgi:hypothetical protein